MKILFMALFLLTSAFADDADNMAWEQNDWFQVDPNYKGPFPSKEDSRRYNLSGELVGWEVSSLHSQSVVFINCKSSSSYGSVTIHLTDEHIREPSCMDLGPSTGQKICDDDEKKHSDYKAKFTGCTQH